MSRANKIIKQKYSSQILAMFSLNLLWSELLAPIIFFSQTHRPVILFKDENCCSTETPK
jgi:hypothetical protein